MVPILVSAYINIQRDSKEVKSLQDYLQYAIPLLNLDHPKIIFLEQHVIDILPEHHSSTKIIPFEKGELWIKQMQYNVELPINRNPNKDTYEYMALILNKTDWVMKALNHYPEHGQFIWLDFGLTHICKFPNYEKLKNEYYKIRIPGCINPQNINVSVDDVNWYLCGGLFGGNRNKLEQFDSLVKKYTRNLLKQQKITWEVNIWAMILKDHPEMFEWYYSDHDCGMINNY